MSLQVYFLALWLRAFTAPWQVAPTTETPEQLDARLDRIHFAVAAEAAAFARSTLLTPEQLAAATLVIWHGESRFGPIVHAGGVNEWGSDRGKARCLGQLHSSRLLPRAEWEQLGGTDTAATRRCARATMRVFNSMLWLCEGDLTGAFSAYATGRGCAHIELGRARARKMQLLSWRLVAAKRAASL